MSKPSELKLCPNCPLKALYLEDAKREAWIKDNNGNESTNSNIKLCMRMRALAREHGILYECPHFNYGLIDQPQQPQPIKQQKQQTL